MLKSDFSNFIEIPLRHGCSPVNLLHIFRTPFRKNTAGGLLLNIDVTNINNYSSTAGISSDFILYAKITKILKSFEKIVEIMHGLIFVFIEAAIHIFLKTSITEIVSVLYPETIQKKLLLL